MRKEVRNVFGSPGLRLLQLCTLLSSTGRTYTLGRLAGLFKCSRQTILRMMDQLTCAPGIDIETWLDGAERHYRIAVKPAPLAISLTDDTLRYVAFCRDILRHLLPDPVKRELTDVLGEADDAIASANAGAGKRLAEPWLKGRIDYAPFQETLDDVQTAMRERRLCRVDYRARSSGQRHHYLIAPLRIVVYREALYIRCRDYSDPANTPATYRTLAIHRIQQLRADPRTFDDAPRDDREPCFGFPFHEPIRVRALFHGPAAQYVRERLWSADQTITKRHDRAVELNFTTTSKLEVIAWILSFGPDAELLEPKELREELSKQVAAIQERYKCAQRYETLREREGGHT